MKKHKLVAAVGTLALAANLLLPNLAFGQQTGSVDIDCPAQGAVPALDRVPANVTFEAASGLGVAGVTPVTSPLAGTASAFDQDADDFTLGGTFPGGNTVAGDITSVDRVPNDHLLAVRDLTSQGVDDCGGLDNYGVSATITTTDTGGNKALITPPGGPATDKILASTINVVTTTLVGQDLINNNGTGGPTLDAGDGVYYNDFTATGNPHRWVAGAQAGAATDFTVPATYTAPGATLETSVPLLTRCAAAGENTDVSTGVALYVNNGVHALQQQGTYSGTIQYTMAPVAC